MEGQRPFSDTEGEDIDDFPTPTESIFTPTETTRDEERENFTTSFRRIAREQIYGKDENRTQKNINNVKSPYEHTFLHVRDSGCAWQNEIIPVKDICDDADGHPSLAKLLDYFETLPHTTESFSLHFDREADVLILDNEIAITTQRQFSGAFQYIMSKNREAKTISVRCHICRKGLLIRESHKNFTWGNSLW